MSAKMAAVITNQGGESSMQTPGMSVMLVSSSTLPTSLNAKPFKSLPRRLRSLSNATALALTGPEAPETPSSEASEALSNGPKPWNLEALQGRIIVARIGYGAAVFGFRTVSG